MLLPVPDLSGALTRAVKFRWSIQPRKTTFLGWILLGPARLWTTARYAQVATTLIVDTSGPLDRLTLAVTPPS